MARKNGFSLEDKYRDSAFVTALIDIREKYMKRRMRESTAVVKAIQFLNTPQCIALASEHTEESVKLLEYLTDKYFCTDIGEEIQQKICEKYEDQIPEIFKIAYDVYREEYYKRKGRQYMSELSDVGKSNFRILFDYIWKMKEDRSVWVSLEGMSGLKLPKNVEKENRSRLRKVLRGIILECMFSETDLLFRHQKEGEESRYVVFSFLNNTPMPFELEEGESIVLSKNADSEKIVILPKDIEMPDLNFDLSEISLFVNDPRDEFEVEEITDSKDLLDMFIRYVREYKKSGADLTMTVLCALAEIDYYLMKVVDFDWIDEHESEILDLCSYIDNIVTPEVKEILPDFWGGPEPYLFKYGHEIRKKQDILHARKICKLMSEQEKETLNRLVKYVIESDSNRKVLFGCPDDITRSLTIPKNVSGSEKESLSETILLLIALCFEGDGIMIQVANYEGDPKNHITGFLIEDREIHPIIPSDLSYIYTTMWKNGIHINDNDSFEAVPLLLNIDHVKDLIQTNKTNKKKGKKEDGNGKKGG